MGNQRTDADNRVVDVFGEHSPHCGANFVVADAAVTVGSGEALQVGDRFDIPNDDASHVAIHRLAERKSTCALA
jgi:hypothetical protein